MPILPIEKEELKGPKNKILRAHSKEVSVFGDPALLAFIQDMHDTLASTENGVGLAAPQVSKNIRLFIASSKLGIRHLVYINPVITKISQELEVMEEGCLSMPGKYGNTRRAPALKVEAYDENGKKFKIKAEGLVAQLIQHEISHLNGSLFCDIAKDIVDADDISYDKQDES